MAYRSDEISIFNQSLRQIQATNKRLEKAFQDSLDIVEAEIIKLRTSLVKEGRIRTFKEDRLLTLYSKLNQELIKLRGTSGRIIQSGYYTNYSNTYYTEAFALEKMINTELGLPSDFFLSIPELNTNIIKASFDQRIGGHVFKDRTLRIQQTMQYLIQDAVAQNIIAGESVKDLAKNLNLISEVFDKGLNNTTLIARTELLKAYSIGQDHARHEAENSGVEFKYIWKSTLDSRVRPDHASADQQEAVIDETGEPVFTVGGVRFRSPRVPVVETGSRAQARQIINCRCRRLNIPFDIKPTKRVAKKKNGQWVEVNADVSAAEWVQREYGVKLKNN